VPTVVQAAQESVDLCAFPSSIDSGKAHKFELL
jgi:hypothetical protein